jgi:hypothetical protein
MKVNPSKLRTIAPLIICLAAMLAGSKSSANQLLDYGPFSGYGLGKGILGNDYTTPLPGCIKGNKSPLPASAARVWASIVYTADEYKQAFHVDQTANATVIGGGGEELHIGIETGKSRIAFDIFVEAYGEHDSDTLDNVEWDEPFKTLMAANDPVKRRHMW